MEVREFSMFLRQNTIAPAYTLPDGAAVVATIAHGATIEWVLSNGQVMKASLYEVGKGAE